MFPIAAEGLSLLLCRKEIVVFLPLARKPELAFPSRLPALSRPEVKLSCKDGMRNKQQVYSIPLLCYNDIH